MALDEALMRRACRTGEWVLRVYAWSRPTLSLGRHQRARGLYDLESLVARGIDVVRRPTGGRALLHDDEVTYSVTAPLAQAGPLANAYARVNAILLGALRSLGADARIASAGEARVTAPGTIPCFDHPSPGEIVVGGAKLVASAQWRDEGAFLQHGAILLGGDQRAVSEALVMPEPLPPPPATLRGVIGSRVDAGMVFEALVRSIGDCEASSPTELLLDETTVEDTRLLRQRYLDPAWTWRR